MKVRVFIAACAALLCGAGCQSSERFVSLEHSISPLRAHFNHQSKKLRVVGIFSPT
jgi:hypothetical protein